jgi:hypothetical protein
MLKSNLHMNGISLNTPFFFLEAAYSRLLGPNRP